MEKMSSQELASNNNQVPEGYKKTEVGVIPEDWDVVQLGFYVDINSGESPSKFDLLDQGTPYFKVEQLNNDSKYLKTTPYYFKAKKTIPAGSLIFPKRGASILLNKVRILAQDSFMDTNLMTLTTSDKLENEYLYYFIDYAGLSKVADTTSIPQINNKHIVPFLIPFPNPKEQKAIAQTLSDVDVLIAALDKLIAKKRNIKTATMQQLLTGKTRLLGFGGEWENFYLCDLFEITAGGDLVKSEYSEIQTNTYPYPIYANSVINGGLYGYSSFEEYKGDCITITARGTLGFACYRHTSFVAIGRLLVLSPRLKLDAFFFAEAINHQIQFANESTSVPQLTAPQTAQYRLSIPKLEEQKAIAQVLSDMDSEITALEKRRAKTQAIKQGMMQELLTGKTRLI
jgi:type I restriction enzyme S subunit